MPIDTSSYYPESTSSERGTVSLAEETGGDFLPHSRHDEKNVVENKGGTMPDGTEPEGMPGPRWLELACNVLSWVFVPLMMPVYGIMLIFGLSILDILPMHSRVTFTMVVFGFNVLVPMGFFVLLKRLGYIDDIGLNGRKERLIPYLVTIACMGATAWFMYFKGAPMWVCMFFVGGTVAGVVNFVVNFWWKISAHAAGVAGLAAMLLRIMHDGFPEPQTFAWLIAVILLAGALGGARVWLGRHTVGQVLAGFAVGFCSVFFITMI